tara:strand:+ start:555 stop:986 length:432 start_codon:yes stop_codon:yes gene_type:complete
MKKKRLLPVAKKAENIATMMQRLVRLKAADDDGFCRCITCGKIRQWNDGMQGAHFFSRGRLSTKLTIENCHPACAGCNKFVHHTTSGILEYRRYMIDMIGEDGLDELEAQSRLTKKFTHDELDDIRADYAAQIKHHEKRIGVR